MGIVDASPPRYLKMPIPGLTDIYQLMDWLNARKAKGNLMEEGEYITILREKGGVIRVDVTKGGKSV